jgi:hypothetical protein
MVAAVAIGSLVAGDLIGSLFLRVANAEQEPTLRGSLPLDRSDSTRQPYLLAGFFHEKSEATVFLPH